VKALMAAPRFLSGLRKLGRTAPQIGGVDAWRGGAVVHSITSRVKHFETSSRWWRRSNSASNAKGENLTADQHPAR
jgi:hypothetical protein